MFNTSRAGRVASSLGAGTLGLLVLSGPTPAIGADNTPDLGYAKHGNVVVPSADPTDRPANWRRLLNEIDSPAATSKTDEATRPDPVADDGSVELALGGLIGATIAAAGAGALAFRRRRHVPPAPLTGM